MVATSGSDVALNTSARQLAKGIARSFLEFVEQSGKVAIDAETFVALGDHLEQLILNERAAEILMAKSAVTALATRLQQSGQDVEQLDRLEALFHVRAKQLIEAGGRKA